MSDTQTFRIPTADEVASKVVALLSERGMVVPGKAMDIKAAADYLGLSEKTVRGLVEHGKIRAGNASLGTGEKAKLIFSIVALEKFSRGE